MNENEKATLPETPPADSTHTCFCVLDDGETYSGAEGARISIWKDDIVDKIFFDGDINDFDDAYKDLKDLEGDVDEEGKQWENLEQPLDISLDVIMKYIRKDWGRFATFCRENNYSL